MATLTSSDGEKSSVTKSLTTPSTPQAYGEYVPAEAGMLNPSMAQNGPGDHISDVVNGRELPSDSISLEETPMVCNLPSSYYLHLVVQLADG